MSGIISRRTLTKSDITSAAGAAGLVGAIRLADHYGLIPPDHGGLYGVGETLSYASQRLVDRPSAFSLADLKGCSSHTQITHQACEEGGGVHCPVDRRQTLIHAGPGGCRSAGPLRRVFPVRRFLG